MAEKQSNTFQHRFKVLKQLLDSDKLTTADKLRIYYYAWRIELAVSGRDRHKRILNKYGTRMNNYVEIHNFAEDLEKHL